MMMYILSLAREKKKNFFFGLIQFIGSTRPEFDVWPNWWSYLNFI